MPTLAAAAIAKDEARDLPGWLENVFHFVDEAVVVVDAATTDETRELLAAAEVDYPGRVRWMEREKSYDEGFAGQRNASLDLATADWVLHMDIDMRATPELGAEIRTAIQDESKNGFYYRLLNHFLHHPVTGGGWATWNKAWLGRRGAHHFANHIHEVTHIEGGDAATGQLAGLMWHLNDENYVERVGKNLQYMQGSGRKILERGIRVRWYHMVLHPAYRAFKTYVAQGLPPRDVHVHEQLQLVGLRVGRAEPRNARVAGVPAPERVGHLRGRPFAPRSLRFLTRGDAPDPCTSSFIASPPGAPPYGAARTPSRASSRRRDTA